MTTRKLIILSFVLQMGLNPDFDTIEEHLHRLTSQKTIFHASRTILLCEIIDFKSSIFLGLSSNLNFGAGLSYFSENFVGMHDERKLYDLIFLLLSMSLDGFLCYCESEIDIFIDVLILL